MSYPDTTIKHTRILTSRFRQDVFRRCELCGDQYASVGIFEPIRTEQVDMFSSVIVRAWRYKCSPCWMGR